MKEIFVPVVIVFIVLLWLFVRWIFREKRKEEESLDESMKRIANTDYEQLIKDQRYSKKVQKDASEYMDNHRRSLMEIKKNQELRRRADAWKLSDSWEIPDKIRTNKKSLNNSSLVKKNEEGFVYDNGKVLGVHDSWEDLQEMEERVNERSCNAAEMDDNFDGFGHGGDFGGGGADSSWDD